MAAPTPKDKRTQVLLDEAFDLMERALILIDEADLSEAASRLDHAICIVADAQGKKWKGLKDEAL